MAPWKRRARVLGICAAVYSSVFLFVNVADKLLLWPQRGQEPAGAAERWIIPDGKPALEVWRARSRPEQTPDAFVLQFPGNSDRPERWIAREARAYAYQSVEFWGVNYPGFGGSAGPSSLQGVADAADRASAAVLAIAAGRPVFAFGASMGTAAALRVAAHHDLAGVMLQNPPALRQLILREHGWWNLWLLAIPVSLQIPSSIDSLANAAHSHAPAAFVTADHDTTVPPYIHRMVIDAYAGPKEVHTIVGGDHNSGTTPEVGAALSRWFAERMREGKR